MAVIKEEELYSPLKLYFENQGFEVKAEVKHCDLVAYHPQSNETLIVEMKKSFNLALLLQGVERQRLADKVYLAIERNRKKSGAVNQRYSDITELCRRLELGLITITFYKTKAPIVEVLCHPGDQPIRHVRHRQRKKLEQEFKERSGDYNVGGSHGSKLITAYREKALRIAVALNKLEQAAPREITAVTQIAPTGLMLRNNYYGWFEKVSRGKYKLSSAGIEALQQYESVIANWKS